MNENIIKVEETKEVSEKTISIDQFFETKMVVGEVISCEKHPDADKLLISQVNIGSSIVQIVSGIAEYYSATDMVGKKVIIISNLKPVKLRGIMSAGMVLCATTKSGLSLIETDASTEAGDVIK